MNKTSFLVSAILAGFVVGAMPVLAADPMAGKEAQPRLKERLLEDSIRGDVIRVGGEHVVIRDTNGKEVRLHVDQTTKMDKVLPGDRVKAYVTEGGHVTTLQRVE